MKVESVSRATRRVSHECKSAYWCFMGKYRFSALRRPGGPEHPDSGFEVRRFGVIPGDSTRNSQ